jgi:telomerase reverse transcriptase
MSTTHFPEGKLRILPKKGTFRPIITFNKKMKVDKGYAKQTLQKILANTQLVLRNMKNNLWNKLGFSVFDNRQIRKKFDSFIQKWRAEGCPKLAYFTLDIKKCYDSINTHKLLEIIENTPFI